MSWLRDAISQIVVLPVVCVSLCGFMTVGIGLECVETLQRRGHAAYTWLYAVGETPMLPPDASSDIRRRRHSLPWSFSSRCSYRSSLYSTKEESEVETFEEDRTVLAELHIRPLKRQKTGEHQDSAQISLWAVNDARHSIKAALLASPDSLKRLRSPVLRPKVCIWDLDETLVLFASLYTGAFAAQHGRRTEIGIQLGEHMMHFLVAILEKHFFFNELHTSDIDHISCTRKRECAWSEQYARIRAIYERRASVDFMTDPNSQWFVVKEALINAINAFSKGWGREVSEVLQLTSERNGWRNVLVTNSQLAPALCKCMIYGLDSYFPIDAVYSSAKRRKKQCFEDIMARFGDAEYIAVGDGLEEEQVSQALGMKFYSVRGLDDLKELRFRMGLDEKVDMKVEAS